MSAHPAPLRRQLDGERATGAAPRTIGRIIPRRVSRIVAVGGGKGGIGKTAVAANLGIELALRGSRVVLIDCDLGGANLHTFLGMERPASTLSDFVQRRVEDLDELVVPTSLERLDLISGAQNSVQAANPLYQQKQRLLRNIERLDADTVVMDLGAGTDFNVLDFFLLADQGVLVVVPEPSSVENAYRFLKAAFLRRLKTISRQLEIEDLIQQAVRSSGARALRPVELVAKVRDEDPERGAALESAMDGFRPLLLVNQTREPSDLSVGEGIVRAARTIFGINLRYLGDLRFEDQAWRATRARRAFRLDSRLGSFAQQLGRIADRLLEMPVSSFTYQL